jgi:hypothetical protein
MTVDKRGPQKPSGLDVRRFKLKPNVHYEGVPWFRDEGVFLGEVLADQFGSVRLFAPEGAPEPQYIDVQSYWVTRSND